MRLPVAASRAPLIGGLAGCPASNHPPLWLGRVAEAGSAQAQELKDKGFHDTAHLIEQTTTQYPFWNPPFIFQNDVRAARAACGVRGPGRAARRHTQRCPTPLSGLTYPQPHHAQAHHKAHHLTQRGVRLVPAFRQITEDGMPPDERARPSPLHVDLEVTVIEGHHFPKEDSLPHEKCDPFCVLTFNEQQVKTRVENQCYDCVWNEKLAFFVHSIYTAMALNNIGTENQGP